jgi:hypothetical protein
MVKTFNENLLSGAELKCNSLDHYPEQDFFTAKGPGTITLDNSKISVPKKKLNKFSLRRPCYAFLRDFESLEYYLEKNQIIADAPSEGALRVDYIPIVEGKYGQHVIAAAGHTEIDLIQTEDSQTELSTLIAAGGITYEDGDKQFVGSRLYYDHSKSFVQIQGDRSQPCYLNGALVDGIKIDLKTGKVKAEISSPGALQMQR